MAHSNEFTQALLDDVRLRGVMDAFIQASVAEHGGADANMSRFLQVWLTRACEEGFKLLTKHTESPLERVFLAAFMLGFMKWAPLGFVLTPVFSEDTPSMIERYRVDHKEALQAADLLKERTGTETPISDLITIAMRDDSPLENSGVLVRHLCEEELGTWDQFHLTLQPKFTRIRVDGRSIRADALVWIPSKPSFNVILECDGYEFHSDKLKFTSDRRRDRVLASHGYRVMRFSGQEVFEDPVSSASEAFDFLLAQRS